MNKWLILLSLSIAACSGKQEGIKPQIKPLMEAVYASGFVVADKEYKVTAQVDGALSEMLVKEGDTIKIGQPLFVIESRQQNARLSIARETFQLAKKITKKDLLFWQS